MEYQSMPVLSMKFKIPQPRKNYISRPILFEKLGAIEKIKLTIVKAGAGSGKTTLLASFIKETAHRNVCFITLDENMNQVFVFWKYFMEGTKNYLEDSATDFESWFNGTIQKDTLWQLLSHYMNKIDREQDITVVLDDFQCITEKFLISTIDFLIQNMPDNLHLVLLTRAMPDIYLGTVSMEDKLLFIDEQELRMTREESRAFLLHTLNAGIREEELLRMVDNSNGWVGGLQLMAVAAKEQSRSVIPEFNTANRLIEDYITNEIYGYLSEEEREFLKRTSLLGYFNQRICRQYIPQYNFQDMMGAILNKNLFVVSIDEEAQVYRYHSIMRDYLNSRFDNDQEQKRALHNLAAEIYYGAGDYEESLNQLFAAHEYEKIMNQLLKMPQNSLTFSYIVKVPMEEIIKNTDFAYQYLFCYYINMDVDTCGRIYELIKNSLKEDATFEAIQHVNMFFDVPWQINNVNIVSLEQIEAMALNPVTKAYLLIKEGYFLFISDQYTEALQYLDKAHEIYERSGNAYIETFVLAEKTQILEDLGELKQSLFLYRQMKNKIEGIPTMLPSYYIGISGVYIKQLAITRAKEALRLAKEAITIPVENVNSAYLYTLAELAYITGEPQKTEEIITQLAKGQMYSGIIFSARLLRYPIYRGRHRELAAQYIQDYQKAEKLYKNLEMELLYVGIIYENGDVGKAIRLVDALITKARKLQNKLKIVEGALLKVRILLEKKDSARDVLNLFIEAVSYAFVNTIALPFWFEKETVIRVLEQFKPELLEKLSAKELDFVQNITKSDQDNGLEPKKERAYDLTERELEVLKELEKGGTNKQIAENLCISVATVKSHIINIYGKLGVNNRVAAVNKIKHTLSKGGIIELS